MSDETWDRYGRFQREHAEAQTDQAWERCAAVTMPLGRVVTATVIDHMRVFVCSGVYLDLDVPFPGVLYVQSYPPEFDGNLGQHPPIGSTIRVIVVDYAIYHVEVSARPEDIDRSERLSALTTFALHAPDGHESKYFAAFEKRDWRPGDVVKWHGLPLRVARMIEPEQDDQLPVLVVEVVPSSA